MTRIWLFAWLTIITMLLGCTTSPFSRSYYGGTIASADFESYEIAGDRVKGKSCSVNALMLFPIGKRSLLIAYQDAMSQISGEADGLAMVRITEVTRINFLHLIGLGDCIFVAGTPAQLR